MGGPFRLLLVSLLAAVALLALASLISGEADAVPVGMAEHTWGIGTLQNGTYENLTTDGTAASLSTITQSYTFDSLGDFDGIHDGTVFINGTGMMPVSSTAQLVRSGDFATQVGTDANWAYAEYYNTGAAMAMGLNMTGGVAGSPCMSFTFAEGDPFNGYVIIHWLNQTVDLEHIPFNAQLSMMHLFRNWTEGEFLPGVTVSLLLRDPSGAVHLVDERSGLTVSDPAFVSMGGDVTSLMVAEGEYNITVRIRSDSTGTPSAVSALGSLNLIDDVSLEVEWYPSLTFYDSQVIDFVHNCSVTVNLVEETELPDAYVHAYVRLGFTQAELSSAGWIPVVNGTTWLSGRYLQFRIWFSCVNSTRAATQSAFGFLTQRHHESGWFQTDPFMPSEVDYWIRLLYDISYHPPNSRSAVEYSVDGGMVFHEYSGWFEFKEHDHGMIVRVRLWTLDTKYTPSAYDLALWYVPRNPEPVVTGIAGLSCIPSGSSREVEVNFTNAGGDAPWWLLEVEWAGPMNVTLLEGPGRGNTTLTDGSATFYDNAPLFGDEWITVRFLLSMPDDVADWEGSNLTVTAFLEDLGLYIPRYHTLVGEVRSISPVLSVAVSSASGTVEDYESWPSTLTVTNTGHGNATGVEVSVNASTTGLVSSDHGFNLTASGWRYLIPTLGPGEQVVIGYESAFSSSASNGSWSHQGVEVEALSDAGLPASANTSLAARRLLLLPSMSWSVTGWDDTLSPGDTVPMRLELTNAGPGEAHDVLVLIGQENFGAYCLRVILDDLDGYDNMNVYHAHPEALAPGTYLVDFNLTVTATYPYLVSGTPLNVSVILGWNDALGGHRTDPLAFSASTPAMAPTPLVALATPSPSIVEMGTAFEILVNASNAGTGVLWYAKVVVCLPSDLDIANDTGWTQYYTYVPFGMSGWAVPVGNVSAGGSALTAVPLTASTNSDNGTLLSAFAFLVGGDGVSGCHSELFQTRQAFSVVPLSRSHVLFEMTVPKDTVVVNGSVVVTLTYVNDGTGPAAEVVVNVTHPLLEIDSSTEDPAESGDGWTLFRFVDVAFGRHDLVITFVGSSVGNATINATLEWADPNFGPSNASLPRGSAIVVEAAPVPEKTEERTFLEAIYWPWLPLGILLAAALLLAGFLVYYRSLTHVKEVYLGYRDGRLIMHRLAPGMEDSPLDKDIVSTMIQAMQNFVKDTFAGGDSDYMKHMEFGNNGLLIERGELIFIAAIHDGPPQGWLRTKLHDKVRQFEAKHASTLNGWTGDVSKFDDDDIADLFE